MASSYGTVSYSIFLAQPLKILSRLTLNYMRTNYNFICSKIIFWNLLMLWELQFVGSSRPKSPQVSTFLNCLPQLHGFIEWRISWHVMTLYSDYHAGGPTKNLSMLDLLDRLDLEYTRINNLGWWTKRKNQQILALTATISNLQSQLSAVKSQYSCMQALLAKTAKTMVQTSMTTIKQNFKNHLQSKQQIPK